MTRECLTKCLENGTATRIFGDKRQILCFDKNGCEDKTRFKNQKENCFECMQLFRLAEEKRNALPGSMKQAWGMPVEKKSEFAELDLL